MKPAVSDQRSHPHPSPLRLWGFLVTVAGGTMIGVGSILTWADVHFGGVSQRKGIDIIEGQIALGAAVLVLIGIPAMRGALTVRGRRTWASIILVAAVIAGGAAVYALAQKQDRLGLGEAADLAQRLSEQTGLPTETVLKEVRDAVVEIEAGLYLTIVGAALGVAGGILGLAWSGRAPPPSPPLPGDEPDRADV